MGSTQEKTIGSVYIRGLTNVSIAKFKHALDAHLALIPDRPLLMGYTARKQTDNNSRVHLFKIAQSVAVPLLFSQEHHDSVGE